MAQATGTRTMSRDRVLTVAAFAPRHTTPVAPLRLAHAALIGALLVEHPEPIVGSYADPADVTDRAEHIERVFRATFDYLNFIIADTAENAPGGAIEAKYLSGLLHDTASDVMGGVRSAAEECGRGR
jgi:hypothetical protein